MNSLRQRTVAANDKHEGEKNAIVDVDVVWGKTPSGQVFKVPTTHSVMTLFNPSYPKTHFDIVNLFLLGSQIVLYLYLSTRVSRLFTQTIFLAYFTFWRAAYNAGLGYVLTKQSKKRWIEKQVKRLGLMDEKRKPETRRWVKNQLVSKMGKDYEFDELPVEYNTWLLFRQAVDIILLNDFVAYCMFAFACFRVPEGLSTFVHVMRWIGGIALIGFNLWVKTEAHAVVKDYGWYWGDCFFQRGALVFDGVFELAPHPMYSVGYAGYYGLSLLSGSYAVLFVSLFAHAAQFAFLVFFENPHIERLYGTRKPIGKRVPVVVREKKTVVDATPTTHAGTSTNISGTNEDPDLVTPSATEGETAASDTDLETETETEPEPDLEPLETETEISSVLTPTLAPISIPSNGHTSPQRSPTSPGRKKQYALGHTSAVAVSGSSADVVKFERDPMQLQTQSRRGHKGPSQHDLLTKYFRRDMVLFRNLDVLRAPDFLLLVLITYATAFALLPSSMFATESSLIAIHFFHSLAWLLIYVFGLGLLLRAQSKNKFLVKHYMGNYHYTLRTSGSGSSSSRHRSQDKAESGQGEAEEYSKGAIVEAFANFKAIYNASMVMMYVSFLGLVYHTYSIPPNWTNWHWDDWTDWTVGHGNELLSHTLGALLVSLHVWATLESYEVLGVFGWFLGDFFMEEFPSQVEYSGIYRYLNNPEMMGGAAWFGLGLISESKLVFSLALIKHLGHWWFVSTVENPHMTKIYGDSLRKEAGFIKVIKNVASKNARILEKRFGGLGAIGGNKHTPELKRVAKEVKGTFDKVFDETADAVEEFLRKSRPKISGVVSDTKVLLQQSREKLVITRLASDMSSFDTSKYRATILPSSEGTLRFHLGEPIKIRWQAPRTHSRKDWIGVYRVGANKSSLVTKTSSMGMWVPVHNEEWDGDVPWGLMDRPEDADVGRGSKSGTDDLESGVVTFKDNTLPWIAGRYEIRYHHDGKYNVLCMDGPIEIYVDTPSELNFTEVRKTLMRIVPLCLDSDPSLIPLSCKTEPQGGRQTPSSSLEHGQGHIRNETRRGDGDGDDDGHSSTSSNSFSDPNSGGQVLGSEGSLLSPGLQSDKSKTSRHSMNDTNSNPDYPLEDPDRSPGSDPDDFSFWSESQAKRICSAIKQAFGVEYAPEVVVADANLSALANRILLSKQM